jgi:1-acyl-sn-glycerol-3-phosphate acyltransferase
MTTHSINPSNDLIEESAATQGPSEMEHSITISTVAGRLLYWWSLFVAGVLLAILGPPVLLVSFISGRRAWVYPWGLFGARAWLRLSGMNVSVRGLDALDPNQTYVFISNHRSYLDTATLFAFLGRRIGLIAKKELLKVPILGYGMGYVNIMAIDRTNRERALKTMEAAESRLRGGISFGVFAEGTRAKPGQFLPFKKGAFYMAAQAGVPIVPVAIKNTDLLMGKGTGTARRGTIEMVLLPVVSTNEIATDVAMQELVNRVQQAIAKELGVQKLASGH